MDTTLDTTIALNALLNQELKEARQKIGNLEDENLILNTRIDKLKGKVKQVKDVVRDKELAIENLNDTIYERDGTIDSLEETIYDLRDRICELENE